MASERQNCPTPVRLGPPIGWINVGQVSSAKSGRGNGGSAGNPCQRSGCVHDDEFQIQKARLSGRALIS